VVCYAACDLAGDRNGGEGMVVGRMGSPLLGLFTVCMQA